MQKRNLITVSLLLLLGVGILVWYDSTRAPKSSDEEWLTYRSGKYNFEVRHPKNWRVHEITSPEFLVGVNIYKSDADVELPLTHHSNATQVSVFPEGIPTEGVFAESRDSTLGFSVDASLKTDFLLSDGTVWATYIAGLENRPATWQEFGFLWASVKIDNLSTECLKNGNKVPNEQCDPFTGDKIIWHGSASSDDRETTLEILKSFRFL